MIVTGFIGHAFTARSLRGQNDTTSRNGYGVPQYGSDFATGLGDNGGLEKNDILASFREVIVCIDNALAHWLSMVMPKPLPIGADGKRMNRDTDELTEPLYWFSVERNQEFQVRECSGWLNTQLRWFERDLWGSDIRSRGWTLKLHRKSVQDSIVMTAADGEFDPDVVFTGREGRYVQRKVTGTALLGMLMIEGGQIGWNKKGVHEALTRGFAVERLGDNEPCGGLGIRGNLNMDAAGCRRRDWSKRWCCGG